MVAEQNFDAWGRKRKPTDWTYSSVSTTAPNWLYQGYTGHEMLPEFGLINMNGRMYDLLLRRMLSPDNIVQNPENTQNYNLYSYVMNNPLKYTDPTGWRMGYAGRSVVHKYPKEGSDYFNNLFSTYMSSDLGWANNFGSCESGTQITSGESVLISDGSALGNMLADAWNATGNNDFGNFIYENGNLTSTSLGNVTGSVEGNLIVSGMTWFNDANGNRTTDANGVAGSAFVDVIEAKNYSASLPQKQVSPSFDWQGFLDYMSFKGGAAATSLDFVKSLAQRNIIAKYKSGGDVMEALNDLKSVGRLGTVASHIGYAGLALNFGELTIPEFFPRRRRLMIIYGRVLNLSLNILQMFHQKVFW